MKKQPTRGPWKVSKLANSFGVEGKHAGVCRLYGNASEPEVDANARLIAAAPDLLDALRDALCRLGDNDIPESQHLTDILGKGWDAIAKAEWRNT